ncbi:MAG: ribose-5-phosphate isomerase RpiA [Lactovum sp.]
MNFKNKVGIEAAKFVKDGMVVGLGTGSTAAFFIKELARRVREEALTIKAVTTSLASAELAESLGMLILPLEEIDSIDLTVDGADEFDPDLDGIKGGGGALLMEKIVASLSKDYLWIVDKSKKVDQLGRFPLPVEVIQFGAEHLYKKFEEKGYQPSWRLNGEAEKLITDQKHFIIDLHLQEIKDKQALALELDETVGVVEHGLFINMAKSVLVATETGIDTYKRKDK